MHLLIADDHPAVRARITGIIREAFPEAELIVLSGGNEVIEYLSIYKCDLLIMDVNMPGRSGVDILKALRITNTLPVILMSSHTGEQYSAGAVKAGANAFINKQNIGESLIPAIEKLVKL